MSESSRAGRYSGSGRDIFELAGPLDYANEMRRPGWTLLEAVWILSGFPLPQAYNEFPLPADYDQWHIDYFLTEKEYARLYNDLKTAAFYKREITVFPFPYDPSNKSLPPYLYRVNPVECVELIMKLECYEVDADLILAYKAEKQKKEEAEKKKAEETSIEPMQGAPEPELSPSEQKKLLKHIACLALVLADTAPKFRHGEKPNVKQMAEAGLTLLQNMEDVSLHGMGQSSLRESIAKGLELLKK